MKRVAISMRVVNASGYHEPRDALAHDWMNWFHRNGFLPLLIPNTYSDPCHLAEELGAEMLVLTGGNDVIAGAADDTSPERDRSEQALLSHALDRGWPVLAVCRGMHLANLHFGGSVVADLRQRPGAIPHVAVSHPVRLSGRGSAVAAADQVEVNSYHNQGVEPQGLGQGLESFALSEDGLVEAFYHRDHPLVAVQWHPERAQPEGAPDDSLLDALTSKRGFWG